MFESQLFIFLRERSLTQMYPLNGINRCSLRENSCRMKQPFFLGRYLIFRALNVKKKKKKAAKNLVFQKLTTEKLLQLTLSLLSEFQSFIRDVSFKGSQAFQKGVHFYFIIMLQPRVQRKGRAENFRNATRNNSSPKQEREVNTSPGKTLLSRVMPTKIRLHFIR